MKLEWNTQQTMLRLVVLPSVGRVKDLLKEGKQEEAQWIVAKDILGLLIPYRDMENEKFQNAPDSLQPATNVIRMKEHAEQMEAVIGLLYDEKEQNLRPCEEWEIDVVGDLINKLVCS